MLTQQHSQINSARPQPSLRGETAVPKINEQKIPEYFEITPGYEIMEVGTRHAPYKIASVSGYDCFVLAGIEENELFSKLVIMNMNVQYGLAFDINTNKISHHFPDNIQVINKKVSFKNDEFHENLGDMGDKKDVFLKMNIYGDEYLWALATSKESLQKFKQMVIVFHDINNNPTQQRALNKIKCFQKIKDTHNVVSITPVGDNLIVNYIRKDVEIEDSKSANDDETNSLDDLSQQVVSNDEYFKLKLSLQNTVKDIVKNVEKEIITKVSDTLKTEFDNEIEKILKSFQENKDSNVEELSLSVSEKIEKTQERVKEMVKDINTKLIESDDEAPQEEQLPEEPEPVQFSQPTFSPVEKPFSPEPDELKGRNAKKNAKRAAKKAAKKTVVLEELKEDSAEDKESSSSSSPDKDSIQALQDENETIEDIVVNDEQSDVEDVEMDIKED